MWKYKSFTEVNFVHCLNEQYSSLFIPFILQKVFAFGSESYTAYLIEIIFDLSHFKYFNLSKLDPSGFLQNIICSNAVELEIFKCSRFGNVVKFNSFIFLPPTPCILNFLIPVHSTILNVFR